MRFRYGDGFSHSRALALQLVLALIPLGIAFVGLSSHHPRRAAAAGCCARCCCAITPGSTDEIVAQDPGAGPAAGGHGGQLALWLGLVVALVALTTSMGQIERGANRIYGIQRDRPALQQVRPRRSSWRCSAGLLSLVGLPHHRRRRHRRRGARATYHWQRRRLHVWQACASRSASCWRSARSRSSSRGAAAPAAGLVVGRASGPGSRWSLWILFTYALSLYVAHSGSFGSTYGPLTGVMALLLWAYLTSIALFLGIAFCAQLEAVRGRRARARPRRPRRPAAPRSSPAWARDRLKRALGQTRPLRIRPSQAAASR